MRGRLAEQELGRFEPICIPNGINLTTFSAQDRQEARQRLKLGLPAGVPIVLHVGALEEKGRFSDRDGLIYLAYAFETHISASGKMAYLAIAGEDLAPNQPWVLPMGAVSHEELPLLVSASDLFVTPTLADNLPYIVLEAMACSLPVVGSAVGGMPEMVDHGVTGLLVRPRDIDGLGMAIAELLQSPARRQEMGESGRRRVEELYGMEDFITAYESLFRQMVADRHGERLAGLRSGPVS